MKALNTWQKSLIIGSAKTPAAVSAVRTLITQYDWRDKGVLETLAYAELHVEDLSEASVPVQSVLTVDQKAMIVGSAQSRNEVAAVLRLVAEYSWIETKVLQAIQQVVHQVQHLPPTPRLFQKGPADSMASEALATAIVRGANLDAKDELQIIMLEISQEMSNPLHPLFDPS